MGSELPFCEGKGNYSCLYTFRHSSDGKSLVVKRAKDSFDDISHSSDAEMSSNTGLISSGISLNILQHPSEDSDSQATNILEETNNNDGVDNTHEETDREGGMSASTDEEDDEVKSRFKVFC